jgi:hypothetical protein
MAEISINWNETYREIFTASALSLNLDKIARTLEEELADKVAD